MTSKIVVNNIEPDAGISTVSILGIATATKFIGDIEGGVTGNVTGNVTGSSGSCTGNAATATVASGITTTASVNTSGIVTATAFVPTVGQLSHRNKVINGAMNVAQRNMPITSANGYCLDMFKLWDGMDSGVATVDQSTHSPDGFSKSFKVDVTTADTSLAATDYARIHHRIEAQNLQDLAYGTSEAKNIVISFYVRSTTTGTYVFSIEQSDNSNKHCVFNYTVNSANTWERKTFSIAGDTAGVINDDNGYGFTMYWILAAGSNYSSGSTRSTWTAKVAADSMAGQSVNLFSNTSNEFFLTGVQLEVGSVVTPFEHRSFSDELSRCQRYYYVHAQGDNKVVGAAVGYQGNDIFLMIYPKVTMRTAPSLVQATGTNYYRTYQNGGYDMFDSWSSTWNITENMFSLNANSSQGVSGPTGNGNSMIITSNAGASIAFNAEL